MYLVSPRFPSPLLAAVIASAVLMAACGSGGPDSKAAKGRGGGAASGTIAAPILAIEGHSESVSPNEGHVRVLVPPPSWAAGGASPAPDSYNWGDFPVEQLGEVAPGAYSRLPMGAGDTSVGITSGRLTDLFGNGQYAIGRWTNGTDSAGGQYSENQGRVWATGTPIAADLQMNETRHCTLVAATRPLAGDGKTPPGKLNSADADVRVEVDKQSGEARAQYTLRLGYTIGKDGAQRFTGRSAIGSLTSSGVTRSTLMSRFVGSDPRAPYMLVAYGVQAPTAGVVNGIAALQCPAGASGSMSVGKPKRRSGRR